MIPTIQDTKEIIKNSKHVKIDIKETILKTITAGWMEENFFVLSIDGDYIFDLMELEGISDEYFNFINKKIESDGIYITIGYACPDSATDDNIIEYEIDRLDEAEICYTGICTWKDDVTLVLPCDRYIVGNMITDYGIVVSKKNGEYTIDFSFNDNITFGHARGYREISSIENKLNEPLHRMLIKLMAKGIIIK